MPNKKHQYYLIVAIAAILAVFGLITALLDYKKISSLLAQTNLNSIYLVLLFTIISYLAQSLSFWAANRIFHIRIPFVELLEIGFVSNVLINILSAAGVPGHTYRVFTMKRNEVSAGDVTAVSIFHSYFNNAVFLLLVPFAITYILWTNLFTEKESVSLIAASVLFLLLFVLSTAVLFVRKIRDKLLNFVAALAKTANKKYNLAPFLANFSVATERGKIYSLEHRFMLFLLIFFLLLDWITMIMSLGYCFSAFGETIGFGKLLVGFTAGIAAGAVSFIPAGLGIQEGSMAGVFVLLSISLETSVLAILLFRTVYYLLPFALSFAFFGKLILKLRKKI